LNKDIPILPAATVVCTRHNDDNQLEVLLLKRNKALSFASGFWVFPGGKMDDIDKTNGKVDELAAKNAAIREAQEEAGLNLSDLQLLHIKKWTTPLPSNKRFRTWFFICHLPKGRSDVVIDDSEIKDHRWLRPEDALNTIGKSEVRILPPTFLVLVRIINCQNFIDIKNEFSRSPVLDIHPRTGLVDGIFQAMYPGDAGYDSHNVNEPGARHRITGNFTTGTYSFEYHGCDHVFPVSGGYEW